VLDALGKKLAGNEFLNVLLESINSPMYNELSLLKPV